MHDTEGKSNWNSMKSQKVEGLLNKSKLDEIKKKIEQPIKREDNHLTKARDNYEGDTIKEVDNSDESMVVSRFYQKMTKKPFKLVIEQMRAQAKNFTNANKDIKIRQDFDGYREKIKDEMVDKINISSKLLQTANEEKILSTLAKQNMKIKKAKADQRLDLRKDLVFGQDEKNDEVKEFEVEDEDFIDFRKLNQDKVERIVKEQLNQKLPNDIEYIQKLEEKKYIEVNDNRDPFSKKNEGYTLQPRLEKKPQYQEDVIETYSVVQDKANKLPSIPFYREIGPYARDVINHRNESKARNNKLALDLLDEKEFQIDDTNITFDNVVNIVTGRISTKRLKKILERIDYTECSDNESEEFEGADRYNLQQKKNGQFKNQPIRKGTLEMQRLSPEPGYKFAAAPSQYEMYRIQQEPELQQRGEYDQYEQPEDFEQDERSDQYINEDQMDEQHEHDYELQGGSTEQDYNQQFEHDNQNNGSVRDTPVRINLINPSKVLTERKDYEQQFPTPRDPAEQWKADKDTQTTKPVIQLSTSPNNSDSHRSEIRSVDELLKEIEYWKEAKNNSYKLPRTAAFYDLRQYLNDKIEDKLGQLLYLIADDPERKKNLKENLNAVITDVHSLEGKVLDGHLKKNLVFQFLKEYKKLHEEKEADQARQMSPPEESKGTLSRIYESRRTDTNDMRTYTIERDLFHTETEKYNTRSNNYSSQNRKPPEKFNQPTVIKSQNLPQPYQVRSHYMKQTQSSIRRLQNGGGSTSSKPKAPPQTENSLRNMWIGNNTHEDLSDEDDWVQVTQ